MHYIFIFYKIDLHTFFFINVCRISKCHIFLLAKKTSPEDTFKEMRKTYWAKYPSKGMVYKWFEEFDNGRKKVFDLNRSGRPKFFEKINEVKRVVDEFPYSSCCYISYVVITDKNTVKRILIEDLHMKKLSLHWVPHDLTFFSKSFKIE